MRQTVDPATVWPLCHVRFESLLEYCLQADWSGRIEVGHNECRLKAGLQHRLKAGLQRDA
ncbi:MAG: hypothetical protein HYS13_08720 [Planctomycetia bacterium]|nr:hypothetical protein [Planctomycetia bacterium]